MCPDGLKNDLLHDFGASTSSNKYPQTLKGLLEHPGASLKDPKQFQETEKQGDPLLFSLFVQLIPTCKGIVER